jgi:nucleotide-binding universal stress UspA family protein
MPSKAMQFRHVLCPVDFSEYSRTALRYAFALAGDSNSRLTVLFVNDPLLGTAAAAAGYDIKVLEAKTVAEIRTFVARTVGESESRRAAIVTALGQPAYEIQKVAKRVRADLMVLGSRGATGPGKWFFGSTTERVLRSTRVPVLVVPRHKRRSQAGWAKAMRSWPGQRILVPVDLHDYAVADVRQSIDVARAFGATALVLYVVPPVQFPPWLRFDGRRYDRQRIAAARNELDTLTKTIGANQTCRVVIGDTAGEIAAAAADVRAGLIVVTLKRASAPFGPRQGAITYRVLSSEVAPILALPQKSRR